MQGVWLYGTMFRRDGSNFRHARRRKPDGGHASMSADTQTHTHIQKYRYATSPPPPRQTEFYSPTRIQMPVQYRLMRWLQSSTTPVLIITEYALHKTSA